VVRERPVARTRAPREERACRRERPREGEGEIPVRSQTWGWVGIVAVVVVGLALRTWVRRKKQGILRRCGRWKMKGVGWVREFGCFYNCI